MNDRTRPSIGIAGAVQAAEVSREAPLLEVQGLTAGYGAVPVLNDVSMTIKSGQLVGLLGANNAGKSTLIACLSGLIRPSSGRILFAGEDITGQPPQEVVQRGIVHVPEGRLVFPQMSVRDNLMLGGINARARSVRPERLEMVLELFPRLKERLTQDAGTMSGGEQQMLAMGRGLMANGRLLMLDEPSLGLSPLFVQYIFEIIRKLSGMGLTLLLVEQNSGLTFRHASYCYVLERGRVVVEGESATVKQDPTIRKAYLGL